MANDQVGWGLIGATGWADHTFAPALVSAHNARLAAVLSSLPSKAEEFCQKHHVPRGYATLESFLSDPAIEAVWIASPNHLHAEQAIAALRRKKHVLVEKPMAITVSDCRAMIGMADENQRVLGIGYHMRQHPTHQQVLGEWLSGAFGAPIAARAQLYYAYPQPPAEWRQRMVASGGWALGDIGTHLVDLLRWFLGDAQRVHGELSGLKWGFESEDHAHVSIRFASGALGVADASVGAGGPPPRLELYGAAGHLILEGTFFGKGGTVSRTIAGTTRTQSAPSADLFRLQVEQFGEAIRGRSAFAAVGLDGLENVRILSQARGW